MLHHVSNVFHFNFKLTKTWKHNNRHILTSCTTVEGLQHAHLTCHRQYLQSLPAGSASRWLLILAESGCNLKKNKFPVTQQMSRTVHLHTYTTWCQLSDVCTKSDKQSAMSVTKTTLNIIKTNTDTTQTLYYHFLSLHGDPQLVSQESPVNYWC